MGPIVVYIVVLAIVIVFSVWVGRRQIRSRLLRNGIRTPGNQVKITTAPPGSSPLRKAVQTVNVITYTDSAGIRRSIVPRQIRFFDWGDATGIVIVLYDGRKPRSEDRVLFGFGAEPTRWYRSRFHLAAGS